MPSDNPIQNTMDQLNNWADKYQDALDNGVFGDEEKPHTPTPQTSDYNSFFGMQNSQPSSGVRDVDADYWQMVHQTADYSGDPMELIAEDKNVYNKKEQEVLAKSARDVAQAPNPVRSGSIGPDQDSTKSMGETWTVEDLEKLHDLKVQLHDIGSKMATLENNSHDSKYEALKKQIDELSNTLDTAFPEVIAPQGD